MDGSHMPEIAKLEIGEPWLRSGIDGSIHLDLGGALIDNSIFPFFKNGEIQFRAIWP